jgi:glutamate 5-kinase
MSIIVVKLGTNALLTDQGEIDLAVLNNIAGGIAALRAQGQAVAMVSSGAVGLGRKEFDADKIGRAAKLELAQIRSAVGQPLLMARFREAFAPYGIPVAQGLVTRADFASRDRQLAMREILIKMFAAGILPILNENDFLTPEELDFSDNDQVASFVAGMLSADRLILLSNVEGLYTGSPDRSDAKKLDTVEGVTPEIEAYVTGDKSSFGMGGMASKLKAAKTMNQLGIEMVLASSRTPDILQKISAGETAGTRFLPQRQSKHAGLRVWLAAGAAEHGKIIIDQRLSALLATKHSGVSILAVGIKKIFGDFKAGEVIGIFADGKTRLGRGLAKISAEALRATLAQGDTKGKIFVHADQLFLL